LAKSFESLDLKPGDVVTHETVPDREKNFKAVLNSESKKEDSQ
jgi:hypothetical protein